MLEQNAQVIAINQSFVTVEVQTQSGCSSCEVKVGCGTGTISKILARKTIRLDVENHLNLQVGDKAVIGINEKVLVTGALLIYLLPLAGLFMLSLLGRYLTDYWAIEGELLVISGALIGFFGGLMMVRNYSLRQTGDSAQQPVLLRRQPVSF